LAEVVTFANYRPPPRYDGLPWTQVRIEEAPTPLDAFYELETQPLTPVDTDPTQPAYRAFTTELGTALGYWYQILFVDATGDVSQPTLPVQNVASSGEPEVTAYATADELMRILKLRNPSSDQLAAGDRIVLLSSGEIDSEIGRTDPLPAWGMALATEVCLERSVEHWQQEEAPFGVIGLGEPMPVEMKSDTWIRHAHKLAPLKQTWGLS